MSVDALTVSQTSQIDPGAGYDSAERLQSEQVRHLYKQGTSSQLIGLMFMLLVGISLLPMGNTGWVAAWATATTSITLARLALVWRYHRPGAEAHSPATWRRLYVLGAFFSGCCWGSVAWLLDPYWPGAYQWVVFAVVAGMATVTIPSHGAVLSSFIAFLVPMMMPAGLQLVLASEPASRLVGAALGIYGLALYVMAASYHAVLSRSVRLAIERKDLLRTVSAANDELRAEILAQELSELMETVNVPLFGVDNMGRVNEWNQTAAELTGYPKSEVLDRDFVQFLIPESQRESISALFHRALSGHQSANVDLTVRAKGGGRVRLLLSTTTRRNSRHRVVGVIGIGLDVTEPARIREELGRTSKLATLGEMSTAIAHELNQPLSIISLAAENTLERMRGGALDDVYLTGKLERILSQIQRATAVMDHMRIFGRRDQRGGKQLDPCQAVSNVLDLVRAQLTARGIEVDLSLPERCSRVAGSLAELEQVLLNLVSNARNAFEARGGSDERRLTLAVTEEGRQVEMVVEDTAGGIPEAVLPRIFEPFFTTKEIGQGTGLGLSVSYGIVREMGGTIELQSTPAGTRAVVTLPVVAERPSPKETPVSLME